MFKQFLLPHFNTNLSYPWGLIELIVNIVLSKICIFWSCLLNNGTSCLMLQNLGTNYLHLKKKCFQFSMSSYVHIFVMDMISHYDGWDYHLTPIDATKGWN